MDPNAIIAGAAKEWVVSPDSKTFALTFHGSIRFHDGTPLVSADATFPLDQMSLHPNIDNNLKHQDVWLSA